MPATITIPAIPTCWIAHTGILPAGDGFRTRVRKVLHSTDSEYTPYVIHQAFVNDKNEWAYSHGHYFKNIEEAKEEWAKVV